MRWSRIPVPACKQHHNRQQSMAHVHLLVLESLLYSVQQQAVLATRHYQRRLRTINKQPLNRLQSRQLLPQSLCAVPAPNIPLRATHIPIGSGARYRGSFSRRCNKVKDLVRQYRLHLACRNHPPAQIGLEAELICIAVTFLLAHELIHDVRGIVEWRGEHRLRSIQELLSAIRPRR